MKLKRVAFMLIVLLTFISSFLVVTPNEPVQASRLNANLMRSFPKSVRGTWYYYYQSGSHKCYKIKITKNKFNNSRLRVYPNKFTVKDLFHFKRNDKKLGDCIAFYATYHHQKWVHTRGYYQTAGDGDSYRVISIKSKHKRIKMMEMAGGAGNWIYGHAWQSKNLAYKHRK